METDQAIDSMMDMIDAENEDKKASMNEH